MIGAATTPANPASTVESTDAVSETWLVLTPRKPASRSLSTVARMRNPRGVWRTMIQSARPDRTAAMRTTNSFESTVVVPNSVHVYLGFGPTPAGLVANATCGRSA